MTRASGNDSPEGEGGAVPSSYVAASYGIAQVPWCRPECASVCLCACVPVCLHVCVSASASASVDVNVTVALRRVNIRRSSTLYSRERHQQAPPPIKALSPPLQKQQEIKNRHGGYSRCKLVSLPPFSYA
jgi:hypothetical protein